MDITKYLTEDEKNAISVLEAGGFISFLDVKIDDVVEVSSTLRRRTFRNSGKYKLVIACRDVEKRVTAQAKIKNRQGKK